MCKCHLLCVALLTINIVFSNGYVNYEMFKNFDENVNNLNFAGNDASDTYELILEINTTKTVPNINVTSKPHTKKSLKYKHFRKQCPETEVHMNVGTYEIPTHRDLVLFTSRTLLKMFNNYHEKALFLLKDISEATRATREYAKKCVPENRDSYKRCVRRVSKKCESIIKALVATMNTQKEAVAPLLEGRTCKLSSTRMDPLHLIKILAVDEASLEFALPAFLRLLGECSVHCHKQSRDKKTFRRPSRHMTDQDLVVRHFLTNKNYIQLIKDSELHL